MMISTRGRYALRILVDLAEHQSEGYITLKDLAERQGISEKYLESIVKMLVRDGIVQGLRGKGGGYQLGDSPDRIGVLKVLELTEGSLAPVACLDSQASPCERASVCRTLPLWVGLNRCVRDYLGQYTVRDLMRTKDGGFDSVI